MENLRDAILSTRHPLFKAETLLEQVPQFAEMSSAMVKEIEVKRDGEWGQRLLKDRSQTGNGDGRFHGPRDPGNFRRHADAERYRRHRRFQPRHDAEKREMALRYARLVVGSRNFAAAGSFAAKQKTATEDIAPICAAITRMW